MFNLFQTVGLLSLLAVAACSSERSAHHKDRQVGERPVQTCKEVAAGLRPGLVGWWRAEGDFKDSSGNGNNGANAGLSAFGAGVAGQGFTLAGSERSFVEVPSAATLQTSSAISVEAWINARQLGGRIVDRITANGTDGYLLDTYQGKLRMLIGSTWLDSTASLTTGRPVHVAGVYDGSSMTVYIDGVAAGRRSLSGAIPGTALPLRFGADSSGASLFNGMIDEIRIWNRGLSAAEIESSHRCVGQD